MCVIIQTRCLWSAVQRSGQYVKITVSDRRCLKTRSSRSEKHTQKLSLFLNVSFTGSDFLFTVDHEL